MDLACLMFDEHNRGSLEVGKYADFVVRDDDMLTIDPDRCKDVEVVRTIVGGEVLCPSKVALGSR